MLIIGCHFHTRYPTDSTRLNSILFSIFYLLFSASLLSAFSSHDFRFSIFEFRSLTPFPSVTYSGIDTTVIPCYDSPWFFADRPAVPLALMRSAPIREIRSLQSSVDSSKFRIL